MAFAAIGVMLVVMQVAGQLDVQTGGRAIDMGDLRVFEGSGGQRDIMSENEEVDYYSWLKVKTENECLNENDKKTWYSNSFLQTNFDLNDNSTDIIELNADSDIEDFSWLFLRYFSEYDEE